MNTTFLFLIGYVSTVLGEPDSIGGEGDVAAWGDDSCRLNENNNPVAAVVVTFRNDKLSVWINDDLQPDRYFQLIGYCTVNSITVED